MCKSNDFIYDQKLCACEISFYQIVSVTDIIDTFMYCNDDKTCAMAWVKMK